MRKFFLSLVLIFLLLVASGCAVKKIDSSDQTKKTPSKIVTNWDNILKKNKIIIGTDGSRFNKKMAAALKNEIGINTQIIDYTDFNEAKKAIENFDIDMYMGMFPKESQESIDFSVSEPFLRSSSDIISAKKDKKPDKASHVAGVLISSAEEKTVNIYFDNYRIYHSASQLFKALGSGKIDFAFIDDNTYEKSGFKSDSMYVCDAYSYNLVAVFNQKYSDVASEMNIYIAKIKASGVAEEISKDCFGKDLIFK